MFHKLRNKIIIITMAVTTAVLVLSGISIMLFASAIRPEIKSHLELDHDTPSLNLNFDNSQRIKEYIRLDRREGDQRLFASLLCVGAVIEIIVFLITYFASQKIVEPVKDAYDKQKIFIANASHELKTPLAIIQANMEAIEVDASGKKWKDNIEYEITHANKLVLDLLQLAKMDAGSFDKTLVEKVNLSAEIKKRIEMFQPKFSGQISFKSAAKVKNKSLPKQDLLQILDILLDNATKYGKSTIAVTLRENSISVSNDGATISKHDAEKVFDRFYQTDKTREGSGLGLAIAKALCEQNGWHIRCESSKNQASFILTFSAQG